MRDRRHVDHGVEGARAEQVLDGALPDVRAVQLDAARRVGPRAPIDADDLMPARDQALGDEARERAGDAGDQRPHAAPPYLYHVNVEYALR